MPHEVFVCYSRSDNVGRWVSRFKAELEARLLEVTGRAVSIYLDDAEHRGSLSDITRTKLRDASVLVCVVTKAFTGNQWCRDETLTFLQHRQPAAVLHVEKLPPKAEERDRLPELVRRIPGTEFWATTPPRNYPLEYEPDSHTYRVRLNDVAHEVSLLLAQVAVPQLARRSVYLARTAPDLHPARVDLERELIDQGFMIEPNDLLADTAVLVETRVQAALERCVLSVHLVGAEPGPVPVGANSLQRAYRESQDKPDTVWRGQETLVEQQWRLGSLAAARCTPVVWFPTGMPPTDLGQQSLVHTIESAPGRGVVIRGVIADLKARIRQLLEPTPAPVAVAANGAPQVYLLNDRSDDDDVVEVATRARARAYVVQIPKDASQDDRVELHAEYLKSAERALLFWRRASEAWVHKKLLELNKVPAMRNRPRGAFVPDADKWGFQFPPGVDVLRTLADLDRFLGVPQAPGAN